jgi:ApaG protein
MRDEPLNDITDGLYSQITHQIEVSVSPFYLDDQSTPDENYFVWGYRVRIVNQSESVVTLRNRYWRITDAHGRIQEVRGVGVVGEQPRLEPGQSFEYTSGTPLSTPSGVMVGSYEMEGEQGALFNVQIPAFSLDSPHEVVTLH